jgi:hypothetical protein
MMSSCVWHGGSGGVGVREVRMRLLGTFVETMLPWQPGDDGGVARIERSAAAAGRPASAPLRGTPRS